MSRDDFTRIGRRQATKEILQKNVNKLCKKEDALRDKSARDKDNE